MLSWQNWEVVLADHVPTRIYIIIYHNKSNLTLVCSLGLPLFFNRVYSTSSNRLQHCLGCTGTLADHDGVSKPWPLHEECALKLCDLFNGNMWKYTETKRWSSLGMIFQWVPHFSEKAYGKCNCHMKQVELSIDPMAQYGCAWKWNKPEFTICTCVKNDHYLIYLTWFPGDLGVAPFVEIKSNKYLPM